jgi:hypothetical protein
MKARGLTLSRDKPELDIVHRLVWRMGMAAVAGDSAFLKMERWAYANGGPRRTAINVIRHFVSLGWKPEQIVATTLDRMASLLPEEPLEPQIIRISRRQLLRSLGTSERDIADRINQGELRLMSIGNEAIEINIDLRDFSDQERAAILKELGLLDES